MTGAAYNDYYTYRREDGSLMSGPSHTLIEPPMWVVSYRDEVAKLDKRLDAIEAAIRDLAELVEGVAA